MLQHCSALGFPNIQPSEFALQLFLKRDEPRGTPSGLVRLREAVMSEDLYHKIRVAQHGGPIPAGELNPLVKELEEATQQKAPTKIDQKRTFLINWAEDQKAKGSFSEPTAEMLNRSRC